MPQFGSLHDDGVLFVSAKSISEGSFRVESLPERPSQTKAPPLYPAYLSVIWALNTNFPDNLKWASVLSWLALVALMLFSVVYYRANSLSQNPGNAEFGYVQGSWRSNPYLILFGCTMFSEVFFTCWVLATLLAIARPGVKWAIFAGLLAGAAYLSRTAGDCAAGLCAIRSGVEARLETRRGVRDRDGTRCDCLNVVAKDYILDIWTRRSCTTSTTSATSS